MIVYQDKEIIVCKKPFGVSSQASNGENMIDMLKSECGCDIYPVHRLDVQTTGHMVYAKTEYSAKELSKQMQERTFKKEYVCLCHGDIDEKGEMVDFLYHDRIKNKSFVTKTKRNGSRQAILEYEKIGTKRKGECELSLVKIVLHTRRTHQIRVQLSSRGFPLYGDGKYGAKDNDRIALHSSFISFIHPKTKECLEFSSAPDFLE